ncbi:carbohydate-binding domain-containing protein [Tatumella sp. JGM130]|uniref:family 20 glycosylhydrolase n=1 Tax=Tatumella sp. JGM130 TaxID=2799797 RepID=UPI001BAF33AF|nr:family 20 glycosylhydrolase [Tatumella sp. JGM130]MBS0894224.1 carbohydate-binding domain-containing protein [Tatumella sp. JGM130]
MKYTRKHVLAGIVSALLLCSTATASQMTIDKISQFGVKFSVQDNLAATNGIDCAALGGDWGSCYRASITLTNPGEALNDKDWAIYFSSIRQILSVGNDQFKITHLVGDLHKIEPTDKFRGFPARQSVVLPLINEYWQVSVSDVLPRWYVTSGGATPKVIRVTDTEDLQQITDIPSGQWRRSPTDANILMTAENRYLKNKSVRLISRQQLRGQIIPTPQQVDIRQGNVSLKQGVVLSLGALPADSAQVIHRAFEAAGVRTGEGYPVSTRIVPADFTGEAIKQGAYRLDVSADKTVITGYDPQGVFYGLQSLLQLIPPQGDPLIPEIRIQDAPRFAYRGIFIDVARNFHSKAAILRTLAQMSAYKLNTLHLHLSDDEGWRLEIPGLPELTQVGASRCHDLSETRCLLPQLGSGPDTGTNGSGFFSREDYLEILRYAKARQITVIPEIDMPAHARAAVISMEARYKKLMAEGKTREANEYRLQDAGDNSQVTTVQFYDRTSFVNPCLPSSRRFTDKVMSEIISMHKDAGQPLQRWHFGGDEAKNIYLGAGYTDKTNPEPGKGQRDMRLQDHPWQKSASCNKLLQSGAVADLTHLPGWFALQVSQLAKSHGLKGIQAWQDGLKEISDNRQFSTRDNLVNFWDTLYWGGVSSVNDWANKGYRVIVSNPDYLYLDMPYEVNPQEPGYYWATRFTDERKIFSFAPDNLPQNAETSTDRDGNSFAANSAGHWPGAYGMSAQVWSEIVRTDQQMEYRLYPRLFSVAERAWHKADWELPYKQDQYFEKGKTQHVDQQRLDNDWQRFANLLGQSALIRLDTAGINYRIPVPGAVIINGTLQANTALPGVAIEYSVDGGQQWLPYNSLKAPAVAGNVLVRSISPDGKRFSPSVAPVAG